VIWRSLAVAFLYGLVFLPALAGASLEAARLPAPVYRTVAVAAASRIYVLGGHDRAGRTVSDVDVFDPVGGVSRRAGSLALPTHGAAAANLGGRILVFGGASSSVHDVVQQFVPASVPPQRVARWWSGTCRWCAPTLQRRWSGGG
jgi:Kelch motif